MKKFFRMTVVLIFSLILTLTEISCIENTHWGHGLIVKENTQKILNNISKESIKKNLKIPATYNAAETKSLDTNELIKESSSNTYGIGRMSIPSVGIQVPIMNGYGDSAQNLSYGACTMKPDQVMGQGNYSLAAHYMWSGMLFGNLHQVMPGSKVYLTDLNNIYEYTIKSKELIKNLGTEEQTTAANRLIENHSGKTEISLATCPDERSNGSLSKTHKTFVSGEYVGKLPATAANLIKYDLYTKPETKAKPRTKFIKLKANKGKHIPYIKYMTASYIPLKHVAIIFLINLLVLTLFALIGAKKNGRAKIKGN